MKSNTVFIVPFVLPWDRSADYQRQTCLALAKHHQVIAYMQRDSAFVLKSLWNKPRYPKHRNIRFYRPLYILPFRRISWVEKANQIMSYWIFEARFGLRQDSVLWIFDPICSELPKLSHARSLYDCVDFHEGFVSVRHRSEARRLERSLIQSVDYFFVNSHTLYKKHSHLRAPDAVVPQGFRLDVFRGFLDRGAQLPKGKPIIGYAGAIDERLDFSLLRRLVSGNPQWRFVFWGPPQAETQVKLANLKQYPNVVTGKSDSASIAKIISQFHVAIIPYRAGLESVRYAYPMKLFEYFYLGKSVVSTPIEELKRFSTYIKIGNTVTEWERHITSLLSHPWPKNYQREQRNLAEENSWQKKIGKILSYL